jgi:quinolinate synthase
MEYVAAGDISSEGVHMLSTGGMLQYAKAAEGRAAGRGGAAAAVDGVAPVVTEAIVATEVGMLYPLQMAAPDVEFIAANPEASCMYMKMITLPKLVDSLREMKFEVKVAPEVAARARVPIDRMVAIG